MDNMMDNTKNNIFSGFILKIIKIILPFVFRTIVLYVLGEKYLGLSSLFTSILQVLNITELGFSTAVIYHMYKPISLKDEKTVCALLNYYKKMYRYIGLIIMTVGLIIMPFLPHLINGEIPNNINLYFLYSLYLFDVVISYYLFSYKSALLNAVCRIDLTNIIQIITTIIMYSLQILVLLFYKNYYLVVICSILMTISNNLLVQYISNKKYPNYQCSGSITENEKKSIKKQVMGLMIGKLSDTSRNSFDSIILSMFGGLSIVAIYNNYYYILNALYALMLVFTTSIQSIIGHNIIIKDVNNNYKNLLFLQFAFSFLNCICCCELLILYQPFIEIWVGQKLMLSELSVFLLVIYFFSLNINNAKNVYFTGNGLWWKAKKYFILESIGNLLLNLILGYFFGVNGIIVATIITIIIFNYIGRSKVMFEEYFKRSSKQYFKDQFYQGIIILISCILSFILVNNITINNTIVSLMAYSAVGVIIPCIIYTIIFYQSPHYKKIIYLIKHFFKNKKEKKKCHNIF